MGNSQFKGRKRGKQNKTCLNEERSQAPFIPARTFIGPCPALLCAGREEWKIAKVLEVVPPKQCTDQPCVAKGPAAQFVASLLNLISRDREMPHLLGHSANIHDS